MKTASVLRRLLLILTTGATGAVFLLPSVALSAASQSFQISPPTANYSGDHGSIVHGTIKVTNLTNQPITLRVGKENFVAKGEEGEVELTDNADPLYSLAPWFNFSTAQVDLPGLATKEVGYTVAIPAGAEPGGRYGSVVFSSIPPTLPGGSSGAVVRQDLGGLVFLRINGPAHEQMSVASFETGHYIATKKNWTPASFFEYGPVDIQTRVKNEGNVHEKATGTITIKNMLGLKVGSVPLDEHQVIPGAIRRLHNTWPTKGHPWLIGRYTAELSAKYDGGKSLSAATTFWVVPWKQLAIALIILILIIIFLWRGRRRLAKAGRILAGRE